MVDSTIKRRKAKGKSTRARAGKRGKASKPAAGGTEQPGTAREILVQRLTELTEPIMEKYGQSAFDELMTRMEAAIQEYTQEVRTLFTEMVHQSREEHLRLKAILDQDKAVEEQDKIEKEEEVDVIEEGEGNDMSEYEKRLERMDQPDESQSTSKADD